MLYFLLGFILILLGSGLGIFLTTYYYPQIPSLYVISSFWYFLALILGLLIISLILKKKTIFCLFVIISLFLLSITYSSIKSKERLDTLLKTKTERFITGRVDVSFLNKVFVSRENKTILVYSKNFDPEFTSIGAHVVVSGNPRHIYHYLTNKNMYGYFLYLFSNNIPYVIYSEEDTILESTPPDSAFLKVVNSIRQDVYNKFINNLPHTSFLSASLIMGESSEMPKEFIESIRISGVSHIFSVSGFHVGVIVFALVILLNILRIPKFIQFLVIVVFLLGYSLIVGLKPPVIRASVLASLILLIRSLNLNPNYLNITTLTGIFMLLINPFLSVDIGFILSFVAVITTILFSRYIDDIIIYFLNKVDIEPNKFLKSVISLFSVSFTAVMFSLPVVILWFGSSSMTGMFSSIILVPLSSLNITGGIVAYLFSVVIPSVGEIMFRTVNILNLVFIIITESFSRLNLSVSIRMDLFVAVIIFLGYYTLLVLGFIVLANRRVIGLWGRKD